MFMDINKSFWNGPVPHKHPEEVPEDPWRLEEHLKGGSGPVRALRAAKGAQGGSGVPLRVPSANLTLPPVAPSTRNRCQSVSMMFMDINKSF